MRRRALLTFVGMSSLVAGCLGQWIGAEETPDAVEVAADAPDFDVDEDAPGTVVLLRIQPQEHRVPGTIGVGDEFDVAVYLGNAGGESIAREVGVELVPPDDGDTVQSATVGPSGDGLPSGAARSFTASFEATVAGDWTLVPGPGIDRVHPDYDGTIEVGDRSDG